MGRGKLEALHRHARSGRHLDVQSLVDEGVDPDGKDPYGRTALMGAAYRSHGAIVELLIKSGADIHCCDRYGQTVLHHASKGGSADIVQCLVNKGVAIDKKDSGGETALMAAAFWEKRGVVELLIKSGADIHCCDRRGQTVLHHASKGGSADIVQCLVNRGVAIDTKDSDGQTALMAAAFWEKRGVVELLIDSGADIHCCDNDGRTVLHHASIARSLEVAQCLVDKGVAIDTKDSGGATPLHLSLHSIEFVDYLLKAGADCNLEDNEGESPFSTLLKKERPHIQTIKLLIEKGAYVKPADYDRLSKYPSLKEAILQDVPLGTQAVVNKFNNRDLPSLYEGLASARYLPPIDQLQIGNGSGRALQVEQAVAHEIQAKGFCNVSEMVPLVLAILCVKSLLEKS